jgi:hypothetical protein
VVLGGGAISYERGTPVQEMTRPPGKQGQRAVALGAAKLPGFITRCKSLALAGTCFACCTRRCEDGPDVPEASGRPVPFSLFPLIYF